MFMLKKVLKKAITMLRKPLNFFFSLKLLAIFITPIWFISGNYCLCKFAFRWTEDIQVAERLIDIWPDIKLVINFWEQQQKSKRPDSKSYNVVVKSVNDQLTVAKLSLFIYIVGILKPYLKKYQTVLPMIPYMYDDLQKIIKTILELIIKTDVIAKGQTSSNIDISDQNNFNKRNKMHLGF